VTEWRQCGSTLSRTAIPSCEPRSSGLQSGARAELCRARTAVRGSLSFRARRRPASSFGPRLGAQANLSRAVDGVSACRTCALVDLSCLHAASLVLHTRCGSCPTANKLQRTDGSVARHAGLSATKASGSSARDSWPAHVGPPMARLSRLLALCGLLAYACAAEPAFGAIGPDDCPTGSARAAVSLSWPGTGAGTDVLTPICPADRTPCLNGGGGLQLMLLGAPYDSCKYLQERRSYASSASQRLTLADAGRPIRLVVCVSSRDAGPRSHFDDRLGRQLDAVPHRQR